ncbi:uncharacterized protein LOC113752167 [Coffea eugenioides]|uniref:uncharacterized protein LOC113752167 n=1 Tax=Coffea eugenioides TaxID=49369 RepID=UPI000F6097C8|nr:uncharacterized protein LOC113752167 [Coffea eugenioides]
MFRNVQDVVVWQFNKLKISSSFAFCKDRTEIRQLLNYKKMMKGYAWAVSAGFNAALTAIAAKHFSSQLVRYGLVIVLNALMWGCYVNSLKALSSLQATVTNFAMNFLSSGLAGFFLFKEVLPFQDFTVYLRVFKCGRS